jgi:hypothetical protein
LANQEKLIELVSKRYTGDITGFLPSDNISNDTKKTSKKTKKSSKKDTSENK